MPYPDASCGASFSRAELSALSLFASADLDVLEPLLRECPVRALAAGEVFMAKGEVHKQLGLLLSGSLGIHLQSPQSPALTTLGAGETVGEISLVDGEPASAFVVAAEPSRILLVDEELLWLLADSSHALAYNLLRTLARRLRSGNATIARERAELEQYKFHASVDGLTGLWNRGFFDKLLSRQMDRARESKQELSLLLLDVDHFKSYNDAHGHVGGDCALRAVAACMRNVVRPTDLIARYGGEELAVILPGASDHNAREVAERLRVAIAKTEVVYVDGKPLPSVTVSIGVASLPESARTQGARPEDFVEAADRSLYAAKQAGRNRVGESAS